MTEPKSFNQEDGVTLRDHLELQIEKGDEILAREIKSLKDTMEHTLKMQGVALGKAEEATNERLLTLNGHAAAMKELYAATKLQLEEQKAEFASKTETKIEIKALRELIDARFEGSGPKFDAINDKFGPINKDLKTLEIVQAILNTKASQSATNFTMVVAIIGILLGILRFFIP